MYADLQLLWVYLVERPHPAVKKLGGGGRQPAATKLGGHVPPVGHVCGTDMLKDTLFCLSLLFNNIVNYYPVCFLWLKLALIQWCSVSRS